MSRITTSKKIAIKTDGHDFAMLRQMAVTVLGAKEIFDEQGTVAILLPDGTLIELYTSHACFPEYLFASSNMVVSYKVTDISVAVEEATKTGLEAITEIISVGTVLRYCHLKLAGGTVIGLYQENFDQPQITV